MMYVGLMLLLGFLLLYVSLALLLAVLLVKRGRDPNSRGHSAWVWGLTALLGTMTLLIAAVFAA